MNVYKRCRNRRCSQHKHTARATLKTTHTNTHARGTCAHRRSHATHTTDPTQQRTQSTQAREVSRRTEGIRRDMPTRYADSLALVPSQAGRTCAHKRTPTAYIQYIDLSSIRNWFVCVCECVALLRDTRMEAIASSSNSATSAHLIRSRSSS